MTNTIKTNNAVLILAMLFFYSCSTEEDITPEAQAEENSEELVLVPKTLATIKLSNGVDLVFRSEEDGIVYEALSDVNTFGSLNELKNLSALEMFMTLTNDNIAVPEDFLLIEEDKDIKLKAIKRGIIEKHNTKIISKSSLTSQKTDLSYCIGSPRYNDFNEPGRFRRIYVNYPANGIKFYSSKKPGTSKCKKLSLEIVNCRSDRSLTIKTYYKHFPNGVYKRRKKLTVPAEKCLLWGKTFGVKAYRYTSITSSNRVHQYGGYLLYSKYK